MEKKFSMIFFLGLVICIFSPITSHTNCMKKPLFIIFYFWVLCVRKTRVVLNQGIYLNSLTLSFAIYLEGNAKIT